MGQDDIAVEARDYVDVFMGVGLAHQLDMLETFRQQSRVALATARALRDDGPRSPTQSRAVAHHARRARINARAARYLICGGAR